MQEVPGDGTSQESGMTMTSFSPLEQTSEAKSAEQDMGQIDHYGITAFPFS